MVGRGDGRCVRWRRERRWVDRRADRGQKGRDLGAAKGAEFGVFIIDFLGSLAECAKFVELGGEGG